jgi:hypothetical protein
MVMHYKIHQLKWLTLVANMIAGCSGVMNPQAVRAAAAASLWTPIRPPTQ